MANTFKTWEPRKQFMALLLCYFAIPVLQGALTILGGLHYYLPYAWQEFLATMAVWISSLFKVCTLLVLIAMFRIKEYSVNRRYQIGLVMLMVYVVITAITKVMSVRSGLNLPISIMEIVLSLTGLILFISASPLNRKVKVFVICTPLIISVLCSIVMTSFMSVQPQYYGVATGAGIFLVQAAIFATLFILLRKR